MSDHSRLSTPSLSSSGGRLPPIARPDWPWAARSYSQRGQQASPHLGMQSSGVSSNWDARSPVSSNNTQTGYTTLHQSQNTSTPKPLLNTMNFSSRESTRQWTFTGFEWAVRDVHKLRDFVEGINNLNKAGESHGDFEVLKQSPMLGDGKFKLEIAPTVASDGTTSNTTTLSLYITSLMVDFAQDEYEAYASLVGAVKCQDDLAGQRGARPEWVWEFWQNDWVFRRGSEVWECPLPSLTSLLENPRIRETDSLVICVQIHCPIGPSIPQQPSVYYVPKDLLDGLEASLDNPNTGDVRFICLEKYSNQEENPNLHNRPSMSSSSSGTSSPFSGYATARKRLIYAHSDILIRRSEYFATMLSSSFAENSVPVNGERKVYTVIVEEADFETMYWLLKYCYANWLLFKQDDDPRPAIEGVGAGWSVKCLNDHRGEWEWKTFHKGGSSEDAGDNKSVASGESLPVSSAVSHSTSAKSEGYHPNVSTNMVTVGSSKISPSKTTVPPNSSRHASASSGRRTSAPNTSSSVTLSITTGGSSIPRVKPLPNLAQANTFPSSAHYPVSPRSSRPSSTLDPHPHPTPAPAPASALAIYQTAHRYVMPHLAALALEHIMSTITPRSSFALLLATSLWEELRSLIEDYVVERWDEVSVSTEFEQCCKEVAAGEWGPDGGKTLMSVFRRLRSPTA